MRHCKTYLKISRSWGLTCNLIKLQEFFVIYSCVRPTLATEPCNSHSQISLLYFTVFLVLGFSIPFGGKPSGCVCARAVEEETASKSDVPR